MVDIALVAMLGGLCVANGDTDTLKLNSIPGVAGVICLQAVQRAGRRDLAGRARRRGPGGGAVPAGFPYLNTPLPGSQ